MIFNEALYKKDNEDNGVLLTPQQIKEHPDFISIRELLYCPEIGCSARLIYTNRMPKGFLKAISIQDHSAECWHHTNQEKERQAKKRILANGPLTDEGIKTKKKGLEKFLLGHLSPPNTTNTKPNNGTNKPKTPPRTINGDNPSETIVVVDPGNSSGVSESELDPSFKRKEPPYYSYAINELSSKHSNKNIKTFAEIKDIMVNDYSVYLTASYNDTAVTFILTEDFFSGINRDQTITFLKDIVTFSKQQTVYLAVLCQSNVIKPSAIKLYVHDIRNLSFYIEKRFFHSITDATAYINHSHGQ